MNKYCKYIFLHDKYDYSLFYRNHIPAKNKFVKNRPTYRGLVVNPRTQNTTIITNYKACSTPAEYPSWDVNTIKWCSIATSSFRCSQRRSEDRNNLRRSVCADKLVKNIYTFVTYMRNSKKAKNVPGNGRPSPGNNPSAAYMRQLIASALVQIMACCLISAKSLSRPMLIYCQFGP